jgi:hypothetical protein
MTPIAPQEMMKVMSKYLIFRIAGHTGVGAKYLSKNARAMRFGFIAMKLDPTTDISSTVI